MSDEPELRPGPPWAMEEMILAQPGLVDPVLGSAAAAEAAELVRAAVAAGEPVVLTGCGTSEHAAQAGAALLGEALGPGTVRARDAFEASLDPQSGGVLVGVSHEAGTAATLAAIRAAADRGARTVLVTALPERAPQGPLLVATPQRDTSWCHTVGYLSPLLAFHAMAGAQPVAAREAILAMLAGRSGLAEAAERLAGSTRLLAVGGGADEITARELALKVEEATHVPVTPLGTEKVLHGHLPAADAGTGLVLLRFDARHAPARDARTRDAAAAAAVLGMPTVTLRPPPVGGLPPVAAALITGALALQLLTLELAHARGTNPDLIRREEPLYRAAAAAAGDS
jgi:glucosamine--fructose-6-phosphate aminotransferase (isomerizing)